ncbi:MAG: ABC transporter permease [Candidatus Bathyarchaeota archaeon]|nr:MAG: ABC transporter permease [Candidatus Bathyarchaeota archaeon]
MGFKEYVGRRTLQGIVTVALAVTMNFLLFRIMPGDPTRSIVGDPRIETATRLALIAKFGLDRPLFEQFFLYLYNLAQGELGVSFVLKGRPVVGIILGRKLVNTVVLMGSSMSLAFVLGIVAGVVAAWRRGSKMDISAVIVSLATYSMPVFWFGMLMLLYLSYYLNIFPIAGTITPGLVHANFFEYIKDYIRHLVTPMVTLAVSFFGGYFLFMRDTILDVFTEDYMLTARAKGLSDRKILFKHAMRNALLPMVSLMGVHVTFLISGATLTETVFSWDGLGRLIYDSVRNNDYPVLQGLFLIMAVLVVTASIIADITNAYLDPRIRQAVE